MAYSSSELAIRGTHQQVWGVDIQGLLNIKVLLTLQGGLSGSFHQSLHEVLNMPKLALVGRHQLSVEKQHLY